MSLSSALFIFNNYVCYKKDLAKNGLLLIFGNIFYNPFYYLKIKRLGWVQGNAVMYLMWEMYPEDYRYSSAIDWAGGKGLLDVTIE